MRALRDSCLVAFATEYDLSRMPTIHTSAKLAKALTKRLDKSSTGDPHQVFDCFYADSFTVRRKRCWIVLHDPTSFAVLLPGMTTPRIENVGPVLAQALQTQLAHANMEVHTDRLQKVEDGTSLAPTHSNRSLTGKLTAMRRSLEHHITRYPSYETFPWVEVAGILNNMLVTPPKAWPQLSPPAERSYSQPHLMMRRYLRHAGVSVSQAPLPLPDFIQVALTSKPVSRQRQQDAFDSYLEALEATNYSNFMEGLQRVLEHNPRHIDGLLQRLEHLPQSEGLIPAYECLANLARQELGSDFEQMIGGFWGFLETRPYMRARAALAHSLASYSQRQAAVAHYQAMLDLNPNDNQGVRNALLPLLIQQGDWDRFDELVASYPDDAGATWLWGCVLAAVVRERPEGEIEVLVEAAREINEHVPDVMHWGCVNLEELPSTYSVGSKEEAAVTAYDLRALRLLPQVRFWLSSAS